MQLGDYSAIFPFFLEQNKSEAKNEIGADNICSLSQLKNHLGSKDKAKKYDKMLEEMGMDKGFFSQLREKPSFIYSEQPNPLFIKNTGPTFGLLKELISYFDVNKDNSGVFALNNDRFTMGGLKKESNILYLMNGLKSIHIADKKFISENQGKAYQYVILSEDDASGIRSVFEILLKIIQAAEADSHSFIRIINKLPHEKLQRRKRIDDFLPYGIDLALVHQQLQYLNLDRLKHDLNYIIQNSYAGNTWAKLWTSVNSKILDMEIRPADKLLNQYILAIKDPHKYMRWNADIIGHNKNEPLAILNFVDTSSGYHRTLFYDFSLANKADQKCFYYCANKDNKVYLDFPEVRKLAQHNLTGGPMYIPKYLLRAASNTYFLVHLSDIAKNTKNDDQLSGLHQNMIGEKYPWITLKPWLGHNQNVSFDESSMMTNYDHQQIDRNSQQIKRFFLE